MTQFKDLDPVLHSQLRLAIVSLLMSVEEADFSYLKDQTGATSGNLSIQISKLKEAGYIEVIKKFRNNYPLTLCHLTPTGKKRFIDYVASLNEYLKPGK
ncbi:MAG: transcriptional regulator [Bacteroidales bacterium]